MDKICWTGLLKLNFETRPKKCIFRFLPKISAGNGWSYKIFFANFQILGPLGCQGWVVIPQNVKKSKNHCTLMPRQLLATLLSLAYIYLSYTNFSKQLLSTLLSLAYISAIYPLSQAAVIYPSYLWYSYLCHLSPFPGSCHLPLLSLTYISLS
jgi:hypothetical protein